MRGTRKWRLATAIVVTAVGSSAVGLAKRRTARRRAYESLVRRSREARQAATPSTLARVGTDDAIPASTNDEDELASSIYMENLERDKW